MYYFGEWLLSYNLWLNHFTFDPDKVSPNEPAFSLVANRVGVNGKKGLSKEKQNSVEKSGKFSHGFKSILKENEVPRLPTQS